MKPYICEFGRLSVLKVYWNLVVTCTVWMCICVWQSETGVCGYQCKYIVHIISFYSFV